MSREKHLQRVIDCGIVAVVRFSEPEPLVEVVKALDVELVVSQDYDSLLFGAPRVVRNLAITCASESFPGRTFTWTWSRRLSI